MEISVLDIGATTINLLEATVDDGTLVRRHESLRFVRLGEGTLVSGVISQDAWHSALSSLDTLLQRARHRQPERLVVMATSVLREATNGPAFRKAIQDRFGVSLRIPSTREEAMLVYRGARSRAWGSDDTTMVLDIGGGTVTCALGRGDDCLAAASLPLGVARLWPAFSPSGSLSVADAGSLRSLVGRSLATIANQAAELGAQQLFFSSGHVRAAARELRQPSRLPVGHELAVSTGP